MWLPFSLYMDIPYELFWKLNPNKLESWHKAHEMKLKHENEVAWINGIYVARAIASCFSKKAKYPKLPIDFKSDGENYVTGEPVDKNKQDSIKFSAWAQMFNKNFKEKQQGGE